MWMYRRQNFCWPWPVMCIHKWWQGRPATALTGSCITFVHSLVEPPVLPLSLCSTCCSLSHFGATDAYRCHSPAARALKGFPLSHPVMLVWVGPNTYTSNKNNAKTTKPFCTTGVTLFFLLLSRIHNLVSEGTVEARIWFMNFPFVD